MNKPPSIKNFIKEIYQAWINEKPNQLAAALAYFGMFSFAAVIYIAFLIAGIFINEAAAAEQLYTRIEAVLGAETAAFIQDSVSAISTANQGGSLIISVVSLISLLLAAMGLFLQLKYVLNRIWGVPLIQVGNRVAIIRQRLFAFIMVIALGLVGHPGYDGQRGFCLVRIHREKSCLEIAGWCLSSIFSLCWLSSSWLMPSFTKCCQMSRLPGGTSGLDR